MDSPCWFMYDFLILTLVVSELLKQASWFEVDVNYVCPKQILHFPRTRHLKSSTFSILLAVYSIIPITWLPIACHSDYFLIASIIIFYFLTLYYSSV